MALSIFKNKVTQALSGVPISVQECYTCARIRTEQKWPYVFGGGHSRFGPTTGLVGTQVGFDCSGWVSDILHHGHILDHPTGPLATGELMHWATAGQGKYLTLWVINNQYEQHCFLEFKVPWTTNRWSQAGHAGTICGWTPYMSTTEFTPRHWWGT